jgi:class 3 adenylate cyclase
MGPPNVPKWPESSRSLAASHHAIGFEGRWDYGAIGTVTNLAARLCAEAKPGQILWRNA